MTNNEFYKEYGFPKPYDASDRDMIIQSNLSDLQIMVTRETPETLTQRLDAIKKFMMDTKDVRDAVKV